MRARAALLHAIAFVAAACFRESFDYACDPGEKGCVCNDGLCLAGLECAQDHCVLPGCTLGTAFCNCDDGDCDGSLICWEGAACVPPDGAEGTAGSVGGTGSEATTSDPSTTPTTSTDATSTASTTVADTGTGGPCTPGTPCDGPTLECADYLWGLLDGTCYRLGAQSLPAMCDDDGACMPARAQDCPTVMGDAHVVCEPECVETPEVCDTYDPAATVDLAALCIEDGQGPQCGSFCYNESGSGLGHYRCQAGICNHIESMPCPGNFSCEEGACNTSCVDQSDCAMFFVCMDDECDPA